MAMEGTRTICQPMSRDNATLFRRFAELDGMNTKAILVFAQQYGWLGVTPQPYQALTLADGSIHYAQGEPHLLWVREIAKMREAIYLSENQRYAKEKAKFGWLIDSHLQEVQGRMTLDPEGTPNLRIAPTNLLAAMWLQLALAVVGNKDFAECKFCKMQIEISTAQSGFRTNRRFCTASCKTKDYRKRKREALRLKAKRVPVSQIAKNTGTTVATIRGWLAAVKKPRRPSQGGS